MGTAARAEIIRVIETKIYLLRHYGKKYSVHFISGVRLQENKPFSVVFRETF